MRVLIIGSDTPVGRALEQFLMVRNRVAGPREIVSLPRADCRWRSERQAKKAIRRSGCDYVVDARIQAAADGGVRIHDIDIDRTAWLARACQGSGQVYLYLSSSRVYSGELDRNYTEDDYPDAEDTLGELLAGAEAAVRDRCERHVILRLGAVFSGTGINILTHLLDQLCQGGVLGLDNRLRGGPLAAGDAARVISALLDQIGTGIKSWGIYHYGSSDPTNCYEFGEVVLASASQFSALSNSAVELQRNEEQRRMLSRVLDSTRIRTTFAIKQVPWRKTIPEAVAQYFS